MRVLLKSAIVAGVLLIPVGPCARLMNEGFDGPPGPIAVSHRWQRISYVLIPLGAGLALVAGVALVVIDRR